MILPEEKPALDALEHHGVKGMKWGVRRNPRTGVRPIAKTLDNSRFGRAANANAERYMRKQDAAASKGKVLASTKLGKVAALGVLAYAHGYLLSGILDAVDE